VVTSGTVRLYYHDSYQTHFAARIVERYLANGQEVAILDQTALYPASGGQPADRGCVAGIPVVDVIDAGDVVQHVLAQQVAADITQVTGLVDWNRRFDHMQQHTGQHILSQAFQRVIDARTVSFHLGNDYSTIDLDRPDIAWSDAGEVETAANDVVFQNVPIRVHFVESDDMERFQLRKASQRSGKIRVVEVADYDFSACGGTHVATSAEVCPIKVRRLERRGQTTRVEFVCGRRALSDYRRLATIGRSVADTLKMRIEDVPAAIDRLVAVRESLTDEVEQLRRANVEFEAAALAATALSRGERRVVRLEMADRTIDQARHLAITLARHGVFALVAVRGDRPQLIFARPGEQSDDVATILRATMQRFGGRGGGTSALAQGVLADAADLTEALNFAESQLD
jgi:alanyl-tRNA synthetase